MEGVTGSIPVAPTIHLAEFSHAPTHRDMTQPRRWLLVVVALLVLAGGAAGVWVFNGTLTAEALVAWTAGLGVLAPIGFVLLYGIATVAMVPGSIFDLAGGSLGAALAFLVARYIAGDWVERRGGRRTQAIMRSVEADGWQFVAFVRLVPIFPYNVMNYLLGLTRIPFHQYMLATGVFMAPSTVVYTWIGFVGREAIAGDTDNLRYALLALGLLATLFFLPYFYKRRLRR